MKNGRRKTGIISRKNVYDIEGKNVCKKNFEKKEKSKKKSGSL